MRIFKTNKIVFALVVVIISVSIIPFFQACSNDFDASDVIEEAKKANIVSSGYEKVYLELKVKDTKNLTVEQKLILKEAIKRADPFVTFDALKKEYVLSANQKELNVSKDLFKIIEGIIVKTNSEIKDIDVFQDKKDSKLLHARFKKSSLKSNVRRKIDFFETYEPIPNGQSGIDFRWYGYDVYLSHEMTQELISAINTGAMATGLAALYGNLPAGVAAVLLGYTSAQLGNYDSGNGVVIEIIPGFDSDLRSR